MTSRRVRAVLGAALCLAALTACAPGAGDGSAASPPAPGAEPGARARDLEPAPEAGPPAPTPMASAPEPEPTRPPEADARGETASETGPDPGSGPGMDTGTEAPAPDRERDPEPSTRPDSPAATRESSPERLATPPAESGATTLHIGDWSRPVIRGDQAAVDRCQEAVLFTGPDIGREDGFEMDTTVIVGHDYCGFDHFATLPVGTEVTVTGPAGTRHYEVYAHHITPGRGGPDHGLYWGDITLQACVGPDTGFSYLRRVRT